MNYLLNRDLGGGRQLVLYEQFFGTFKLQLAQGIDIIDQW